MMQTIELSPTTDGTGRKRVVVAVQTPATAPSHGDGLAELSHDARNMVTALGLYCDLLEEPGVLGRSFMHYGSELRLVVAASRRLVEKLVFLDAQESAGNRPSERAVKGRTGLSPAGTLNAKLRNRFTQMLPNDPINNLQQELLANRNLLDAMAGMSITVGVETRGGAFPVKLTGEDLTRVLVNMVKNASESMKTAGTICIALSERLEFPGGTSSLLLTIEDTGPGISAILLNKVFEPGFTTRPHRTSATRIPNEGWLAGHRGLGLSITRSIIEAAGGRIRVENGRHGGARFEIELPILAR